MAASALAASQAPATETRLRSGRWWHPHSGGPRSAGQSEAKLCSDWCGVFVEGRLLPPDSPSLRTHNAVSFFPHAFNTPHRRARVCHSLSSLPDFTRVLGSETSGWIGCFPCPFHRARRVVFFFSLLAFVFVPMSSSRFAQLLSLPFMTFCWKQPDSKPPNDIAVSG